ncbi:MAG: proteinase inhibitor I78 [Proteobacteria bacterium]|nr:proteinase inhibitor I78 [Pseudomonadota bacterium]MBS0493480.1 proteinase inhibitor I78 [Pseudomonadota bacterium]
MRHVLHACWLTAVGLLVLLTGCAQPGPASAPRPTGASTAPVGGTCNAQAAQWALGKSGTARVVEEARVRAGARMARVVYAGQPAQALDAERLSLEVDGSGKIVAARCG